jgi:hypothetical protein
MGLWSCAHERIPVALSPATVLPTSGCVLRLVLQLEQVPCLPQ